MVPPSRSQSTRWQWFKAILIDSHSSARMHTPCHNLRCQNSLHAQPIGRTSKAFSANCIWQPGSKSQRVEQRTLSNWTSPEQNVSHGLTKTQQGNGNAPMTIQTSAQTYAKTRTHKHEPSPSGKAHLEYTGSCGARRSFEVIRLQERLLSGQISTGFQRESV